MLVMTFLGWLSMNSKRSHKVPSLAPLGNGSAGKRAGPDFRISGIPPTHSHASARAIHIRVPQAPLAASLRNAF